MALTRIALVDDESTVRVALGRLLRLADYEVLAYESGEEFLAALSSGMPACAVLDVHLPGLTGIEVQMRLRASRLNVPVVFITASDDPEVERRALDAGGLRVLRKPFSNCELLASIEYAVKAKSSPPRQADTPQG